MDKNETEQLKAEMGEANRKHMESGGSPSMNSMESEALMKHATPLIRKAIKQNMVVVWIPSEYYRASFQFKDNI